MESLAVLFGGLAALWLIQFILTGWQVRAFLREMRRLRGSGRVAVGMGRRGLFRRAYVALAADDAGRVTEARVMAGATVFARPRPLSAVLGRPVADLATAAPDPTPARRGGRRARPAVSTTLPPAVFAAVGQAAGFLAAKQPPGTGGAAQRPAGPSHHAAAPIQG